MILDTNLTFCEAEAAFGTAATRLEGDVADLNAAGAFLGPQHLFLVIQITTTFASAGAATVQFQLASDAAAAIATNGTATVHAATQAFVFSTLTAGTRIILPLPGGFPDAERYLGILVVTAGATTTAGAFSAFLTTDAQNWKAYPEGNN